MAIQNLRFFDNDSNDLNLLFNQNDLVWEGVCYLPEVSTGLYETLSIHILEKVETSLGSERVVTPISNLIGSPKYVAEFLDDYEFSDDIFLYGATQRDGDLFVEKNKTQEVPVLDSSYYSSTNPVNGLTIAQPNVTSNAVTYNIALSSNDEGYHTRILRIYQPDTNGGSDLEIARIRIYGEVVGEDERLKVLLSNMGMLLEESDYFIFKKSDVKELSTDWKILNEKRKELLLQASQIKPFVGTYKALLNAIDFFGYDKITLKEYWLNINEQSENFGKLKAVAVPNQKEVGFLANKNNGNQLPNSNQKKTSRFSLVYRLNEADGGVDEWDIPTVKESLDFSPDEVLIKLYGLKRKLQRDYLPLQAKIVDITGEGDYFSQFNMNVWNNQHVIKDQTAGVNVEFKRYPEERQLFIEDLRKVDYRLTGLDQDFNELANEYEIVNVSFLNNSIITGFEDHILRITGEDLTQECTLDFSYLESTTTRKYVRILDVSFDGTDTVITTNGAINPAYTMSGPSNIEIYLNVSESVCNSIDLFYTKYYDVNLDTFNTIAGIPVGAPVILNVESYNDMWNEANFSWMDAEDTGDDHLEWNNWWKGNIYEVEWIVTGPRGYQKTFRGDLESHSKIPVVLPYAGDYSIELALYDLFNIRSSFRETNYINVKNKNVEIYGISQKALPKLNWNQYRYSWNNVGSDWNHSTEHLDEVDDIIATYYLTLDRANYIHDANDVGGYEFSTVRRYADTASLTGFSETTGPYRWNELKPHVWNDGQDIDWNMTRVGSDINASFKMNVSVSNGHSNGHFFQIIQKHPVSNQLITDSYIITSAYPVNPSDINAWLNVSAELNGLDPEDHPIITKFNFNAILVDNDGDGTLDTCDYILAVGKEPSRSYEYEDVLFNNVLGGEILAGSKQHHECYNPTFFDLELIDTHKELRMLNHLTLSYDTTNMPGIVSQKWVLKNNTLNIEDIYYNNKWLTHLFKHKGEYSVELELMDVNGNINTTNKNIIKII